MPKKPRTPEVSHNGAKELATTRTSSTGGLSLVNCPICLVEFYGSPTHKQKCPSGHVFDSPAYIINQFDQTHRRTKTKKS